LPPQCTSSERQLPKRLKPNCNSTSDMSKIGAKRVQHKLRAILAKHCLAFCVNFVAHFCTLPPQCTSRERRLPKRLKPHCNSTSDMSKIGAKRLQHKRRAILGKYCVAFYVNVVAHFSRLPPQCTTPERQLPMRLKPHCNSTSAMSKMGAKRAQHKRRAILGKHCVAFCVNFVAHVF